MKPIGHTTRLIFFLLWFPAMAWTQSLFDAGIPGARFNAMARSALMTLQGPMALVWNPAALANMRDAQFQLSSDGPYSFNFIGVSQFFPSLGNLAFALTEFSLKAVSDTAALNRRLRRGSFGFGRRFSPRLYAGLALHFNTMEQRQFRTLSLALIVMPSRSSPVQELYRVSRTFHALPVGQNAGFALVWQDIPVDRKTLRSFVDLSAFYKAGKFVPAVHINLRLEGNKQLLRTGLSHAFRERLNFFAGLENFNMKKAAAGLGFFSERHSLDFSYSFMEKKFMVDFAIRLGNSPLERAGMHKKLGIYYARQGKYEQALKEIEHYLSFDINDSISTYLKGWLLGKVEERRQRIADLMEQAKEYEAKKWYISATINYLKVLELDEKHRPAKVRLRVIRPMVDIYIDQLFKRGVTAYEEGNYEQAQRAFEAVLLVRKDHEEAKAYLQKVKDYFASESNELFLRGLGYYSQKNYEMAILSFKEALEYNKFNEEARTYLEKAEFEHKQRKAKCDSLVLLAKKHVQQKDYIRAFNLYEEALALDPYREDIKAVLRRLKPVVTRYVDGLVGEGKAAFERGNLEQAERAFRKALRFDPGHAEARTYLARIEKEGKNRIESTFQKGMQHFNAREWQKAIEAFEAVLSMNSKHRQARKMLREAYSQVSFEEQLQQADLHFSSGQYLKAMQLYTRLLERDSSNSYIQSRMEECQNRLNELVEQHFNRGISYYTAERYRDAIREWEKALKLNPNHTQSLAYKKKAQQRLNALQRLQ